MSNIMYIITSNAASSLKIMVIHWASYFVLTEPAEEIQEKLLMVTVLGGDAGQLRASINKVCYLKLDTRSGRRQITLQRLEDSNLQSKRWCILIFGLWKYAVAWLCDNAQ